MNTRSRQFSRLLVLAAALTLAAGAMADDRLGGYWVPAQGEASPASFSLGIMGKWTIITAHWDGLATDFKVRYTVVTAGGAGTLSADEKPERLAGVPRTLTYEIKGGELFLTVPDTDHAGTYHLVKGVPPPSAPAVTPAGPVQTRPPAPARAPVGPKVDPNAVLGNWTTPPEATVQVDLKIVITGPMSVKITQLWIKGSENPVMVRGADYSVNFGPGGRGTFVKAKVDAEGPQVPARLDYAMEGDTLVINVDDGPFLGQHRLARKAK